MQKWEYAVMIPQGADVLLTLPGKKPATMKGSTAEVLNKLGADGWDLVTSTSDAKDVVMVLKRFK